jgi:hypothetical protein
MAPIFNPMRFVLLCTIDPSLSDNVCDNAETERKARILTTVTANSFFMNKLPRQLFDFFRRWLCPLEGEPYCYPQQSKKGKQPHGYKHLARAKLRSSPSKTKYFNGLVYLVLHAAEAGLEIVGKRACFGLYSEAEPTSRRLYAPRS